MNCKSCQAALPDLLLDPGSPAAVAAQAHLASCADCRGEIDALRSTFDLLDTWSAPEPTPYFDQKLAVRLREEATAEPAGLLERLRARLLFNTGRQFRPAVAGALALVLLIGGGTAARISGVLHTAQPQTSATVEDLQILDRNDQTLQNIDQLLQDDPSDDGTDTPIS